MGRGRPPGASFTSNGTDTRIDPGWFGVELGPLAALFITVATLSAKKGVETMAGGSIIVTAADSAFMVMARGLLASLSDYAAHVPIGILDVGLSPMERDELVDAGIVVVTPGWHANSAFLNAYQMAPWYRAMTARPYLPQYFPGYDCYVWIDSDAWVASATAVPTFISVAQAKDIAIVSSADRSYQRHHGADLVRGRSAMISVMKLMSSERTAQMLAIGAEYCSGVFAMRHDSPIWELWQHALVECMAFMVSERMALTHLFEQVALNVVLHSRSMTTLGLLPARFDWVVGEASPVINIERGCLCEPQPPYDPIEVVHLIHLGRGTDKLEAVDLRTTAGEMVRSSLGYAAIRDVLRAVQKTRASV